MDVPLARVRAEVERAVTRGSGARPGAMQLTLGARRVMELTDEAARRLGDGTVGPEHLLLALVREGQGLAARVLVRVGADLERTRAAVAALASDERMGISPPGRESAIWAGRQVESRACGIC